MHICWAAIICSIWLTVCDSDMVQHANLIRMQLDLHRRRSCQNYFWTQTGPMQSKVRAPFCRVDGWVDGILRASWFRFTEFAWCVTTFNTHFWILLAMPCVELRSVNCCRSEISIDFPGVPPQVEGFMFWRWRRTTAPWSSKTAMPLGARQPNGETWEVLQQFQRAECVSLLVLWCSCLLSGLQWRSFALWNLDWENKWKH